MKTWIRACCLAVLLWAAAGATAQACPMCKLANETSSRLPRAYMCSILFMLGMPATLSTAFGIGFYRLSRKAAQLQEQAAEDDTSASGPIDSSSSSM